MACITVQRSARRTLTSALFVLLAFLAASPGARNVSAQYAQGHRDDQRREREGGSMLTGTYRLDRGRSDDPAIVADRVARTLPAADQQRLRNAILRRLDAPESLAIDRRGRMITLASSRAPRVNFEADGRDQTEQTRNGRTLITNASLTGDQLVVRTEGDRAIDYQVTFQPIDGGRALRVTRRITEEGLRQPLVAHSVYIRTSGVAQLDVFDSGHREGYGATGTSGRSFAVPEGTPLVATLDGYLSTRQAHNGDRFSLTVQSPPQYAGASIEGRVARVDRREAGPGRTEMAFELDSIRFRDGHTSEFAGYVERVRTTSGETIQVDHEGVAREEESRTGDAAARAGIGAAIGAVIGAVTGGGKGAAIGAAVGAGAGAGSVFVQDRDDFELARGAEFGLRVRAPQ